MTCKECKYFRAQLCFDEKSNLNTNPDGETCEALTPADLPNKSVKMILKTFLPDGDIDQTIEAEKFLLVYLNNKRVSARVARGELGFIAYWRAVHRAAFHASACVLSKSGEVFSFDCRKFFKEK